MALASLNQAVEQEFSCYYLADELSPDWEDDLPALASASARRLRGLVSQQCLGDLVRLLNTAAADPTHPVSAALESAMMSDWSDPDDWRSGSGVLIAVAEALQTQ